MIKLIESKLDLKADFNSKSEYNYCISDLAKNEIIYSMADFAHHKNISRLEHSLHVSFLSYLACKKLGLNYQSAARGGLLHDFYFYDSHITKPESGIHCFSHPATALKNASKFFHLNDLEKDIIVKHMWPVTIRPPKYKESLIVTFIDKYCASIEFAKFGGKINLSQQAL